MAEVRTRREPPPFRSLHVVRTEQRTPHLVRVTLGGEDLEGFDPGLPAASVRLLLPRAQTGELEVPVWNGNEFRFADGARPPIRTLTPLRHDPDALELDVDVVLHGDSPLSVWATTAEPGGAVALSGPGRGYEIAPDAGDVVVVGDESALPAISTLLPALPANARVRVVVEVRSPEAEVELPAPHGAEVRWCTADDGEAPGTAIVEALVCEDLDPQTVTVWAAGEAAAVQRIRKHLFDEVGLGRSRATVRGYWKVGRAEGG